MQSVIRKFISEDRLVQLIDQVTSDLPRRWVTLAHGAGWTEDVTKEQEAHLDSLGIKVYEDWPHGGNGHNVDGLIVEFHYRERT